MCLCVYMSVTLCMSMTCYRTYLSSVLDGIPAGSGYPPAEAGGCLLEGRAPAADLHLLLLGLLPARRRPRHQQPPGRRSYRCTVQLSWTGAQQEKQHQQQRWHWTNHPAPAPAPAATAHHLQRRLLLLLLRVACSAWGTVRGRRKSGRHSTVVGEACVRIRARIEETWWELTWG